MNLNGHRNRSLAAAVFLCKPCRYQVEISNYFLLHRILIHPLAKILKEFRKNFKYF